LAIVEDRELLELLSAGRPGVDIPGCRTVSRDIEESFAKCKERIGKLLKVRVPFYCFTLSLHYLYQDHPGRLSFATDAWTSPNHRAFVAWTVHLHHEGAPLSFLLDIVEVPEVRGYHLF
jgi:hypothetical protein